MRKKIILIGSKGMAGHVILHYFRSLSNFEIIDIARNDGISKSSYNLDVTNFSALKEIFVKERPDVVINCIGVLNKDAEDHPDKAILLNSYLPHFVANAGIELNFKLIHI